MIFFRKRLTDTLVEAYEKRLLSKIAKNEVPKHVAIIMDGNRRYAEKLGLDPMEGHSLGRDKLEELVDWCLEIGIKILTVYAFSTENLKREKKELDALMKLFTVNFRKAGDDYRIHKNKIRIRALGQVSLLPNDLQDAIRYAEERTKDYTNYFFNIAIAYGGRDDILNAVRNIANDVKDGKIEIKDIDENTVSKYLYTKELPDPDLILRTSGEERISNFLLWQLAYSELYFSDVYWPEFKKADFLRAIIAYQRRQRRFGE
ncbi:MAG: polyprenyl diphosphate synthase [Candidatus Thermoplasmatota archaeon]